LNSKVSGMKNLVKSKQNKETQPLQPSSLIPKFEAKRA
jgi:hypothetical protein